jgi:hypothetical protein
MVASIVWNTARAQTAPSNAACVAVGRNFVQQATHLRLYMRHYALFERASVKQLPYVVSSDRFAALPGAPEVAATIQGVVGGAVDDWLTR